MNQLKNNIKIEQCDSMMLDWDETKFVGTRGKTTTIYTRR